MKTYTIVAGVNGCGKSSLIGILRNELKNFGVIVDQTNITTNECLEKGICFAEETTLRDGATINTIKQAVKNNYYVRLYYVGIDTLDECLLRIENRVKKGGNNIDTEFAAERFSKRFEDLLAVLPYCNEATFYDNDNGFVNVAKYKNGELQTIGSMQPEWLKELINKRPCHLQ